MEKEGRDGGALPYPPAHSKVDLRKPFRRKQMSKYARSTYLCGCLPQNVLNQSVYPPRVPGGKETMGGIPLVVQWVRIHLPVQAAWAWKDSTHTEQLSPGARTPEPVHPRAQTPRPLGPVLGLLEPVLRRRRSQDSEEAAKSGPCPPQLEKPRAKQQRPSTAKSNSVRLLKEAMG